MKDFIFYFLLLSSIILGILFLDISRSFLLNLEHSYLLGLVCSKVTLFLIILLFILSIFASIIYNNMLYDNS